MKTNMNDRMTEWKSQQFTQQNYKDSGVLSIQKRPP